MVGEILPVKPSWQGYLILESFVFWVGVCVCVCVLREVFKLHIQII